MASLANQKLVIFTSILLVLGSFVAQQASLFYKQIVDTGVVFQQIDRSRWVADISGLSQGLYFVSTGKLTGICDLSLGNNLLINGGARTGRHKLQINMGAPLRIEETPFREKLGINCYANDNMPISIRNQPVVAPYYQGIILHYLRTFVDIVLAPLCALLLLFFITVGGRNNFQKGSGISSGSNKAWMFFTISALLYSLSLSHIFRVFLTNELAFTTHAILRNLFAIGLLQILTMNTTTKTFLTGAYLGFIGIVVVTSSIDPIITAKYTYKLNFWWFSISWLLVSVHLMRSRPTSQSMIFSQALALTWFISQTIDLLNIHFKFGSYSAPSIFAIIIAGVGFMRRSELARLFNLQLATKDLLLEISSGKNTASILRSIMTVAKEQTRFLRSSAYIDAYCFGIAGNPRQEFVRIGESGYRKDTDDDVVVRISESRGLLMLKAIESGKPLFKMGQDGCWYLLIPIGGHACVNFSDDTRNKNHIIEESQKALDELLIAISVFETRLKQDASSSRMPLNLIRSIRGTGTWEEEFGAIFVDVVDYSTPTNGMGKSYTKFVGKTLIPSFTKHMQGFAAAESTRGDEIYFCVIKDLYQHPTKSIDEALALALHQIHLFINTVSAELCRQNGFPPASYRVGCALGKGTIEATELDVKTFGYFVNAASRCQSLAKPGEILIEEEAVGRLQNHGCQLGELKTHIKKKNVIRAAPLTEFTDKIVRVA